MADNSDDLFDVGDSFDFDDAALASIQATEDQYIRSMSQIPAPTPAAEFQPPPAKRKKPNPWEVGHGRVRPAVVQDVDDNPPIMVREDGSYSVAGTTQPLKGFAPPVPLSSRPNSVTLNNNASVSRPIYPLRTSSSYTQTARVRIPQGSSATQGMRNDGVPNNTAEPRILKSAEKDTSSQSENSNTELAALRAQLAEMTVAYEAAQKSLQEATEAKFTKEGEVSILRKTIEKNLAANAEITERLRAELQLKEEKYAEMQQEMRDEMERLKSRLIFKTHELETSTRKPTWSTKTKKTQTGPAPTPVRMSTQMRAWGASEVRHTPVRQSLHEPGHYIQQNPPRFSKTMPNNNQGKEREKSKPTFPSFVNSFQPASPVRSPRKGKAAQGKDREIEDPPPPLDLKPDHVPVSQTWSADVTAANDGFFMSHPPMELDDEPVPQPASDDPVDLPPQDTEEPIDFREQLHYILFTHTTKPSFKLTLQTLLSENIPSTASESLQTSYVSACSALLEAVGSKTGVADWESTVSAIGEPLVLLTEIMTSISLIKPLTALLNLLRTLAVFLPSFISFFLTPSIPEGDSLPPLTKVISTVICKQLSVQEEQLSPEKTLLATEVLDLLDILGWNAPDDRARQLGLFIRQPRVVSTLLHRQQPICIIERSSRCLSIFATHSSLFRPLLSFPDHDGEGKIPRDITRIPLIERLCAYLVDAPTSATPQQTLSIHQSILTTMSLLSIAHSDALTLLIESNALIPSLVVCMNNLTTRIWEDDEDLRQNDNIGPTINILNHVLRLLHHLIFSPRPMPNLRHKLYHSAHRSYNGLTHMFIVSIGRLSYADTPEWIDSDGKDMVERMTELARDLLEMVVEGPESDSIWEAYQESEDNQQDGAEEAARKADEEEMAAQDLDSNEIH